MPKDSRSINEKKIEKMMGQLIMDGLNKNVACAHCGEPLGYLWLAGCIIEDEETDLKWCDTVCHDEWLDIAQSNNDDVNK